MRRIWELVGTPTAGACDWFPHPAPRSGHLSSDACHACELARGALAIFESHQDRTAYRMRDRVKDVLFLVHS